ncbi:MAG: signal peptidase I, partial [Acidimicrobiia bacterium]
MTEQVDETVGAPLPGTSTSIEDRPLTTDERIGTADSRRGRPSTPGGRTGRAAIEWGILIVAALVIAIVIRTFVFQAFYIPSESMVPTLKIGDRVLVNKLSYKLHDPRRGDIVVFKAPPAAETADIKDLVKRLVGLPGETIQGKDGRIYINGRVLSEPYLPRDVRSRTFGPEKVPPDSYFMLGDNRQYSKDSTFFGPIKR